MLPRLHAHSNLPYPPQERLQRHSDLRSGLSIEQLHAQRVKGLDVSFEIFAGKVGVAFHDVDDDRAPGFDVAGLCFVEEDKGADDVGAETKEGSLFVKIQDGKDVTYGISAASVSVRLRLRSSPSS